MIKTTIKVIFGLAFVALFIYTGFFLYQKSKPKPVIFQLESPKLRDILTKTVANGSIVPLQEVNIKPQVSGIIDELYVEAGQYVQKGQLLAKIKIVPNMVNVNSAETNLESARLNLELSKKEFDRQSPLYQDKVISDQEYQRLLSDYNLKKEAFQAAENNLELVREGASRKKGQVANLIYSTISGMILDVPVKIGSSVIERNNFNEGTTIASIADMNKLIFEGKVDEAEVGKIKEGLPIKLTIGAINDKIFDGTLVYIAPKGTVEDGTVRFLIKAKINLKNNDFIRAGLSANADIVLAEKNDVLAIKESTLQFSEDSVFVEIETKQSQVFRKQLVKTGISDGIYAEVISGLNGKEKIKIPIEKLEEIKDEPNQRKGSGKKRF